MITFWAFLDLFWRQPVQEGDYGEEMSRMFMVGGEEWGGCLGSVATLGNWTDKVLGRAQLFELVCVREMACEVTPATGAYQAKVQSK